MKPLSNKLFYPFTRVDGVKAMAFLTTAQPPATNALSRENFRVLRVRQPCLFSVGDVLHGPSGEKILLMEHPDNTGWNRQFKAALITHEFEWSREVKSLHPVAKVMQSAGFTLLGKLYTSFTDPREKKLEGLLVTEYQFLTGQDVQVGDVIGDKRVKLVQDVLGVKLVHAE